MCSAADRSAARRRQGGFGLLESIVALTLLASTGVALFAWINTNLLAAARLQDRDAVAELKIVAMGLVSGVDPMTQPEGERELGSLRVRWTAVPDGPPRPTAGRVAGGVGRFDVQLFTADVVARDSSANREARFELQMVGSRLSAGAATPPRLPQ